MEQNEFYTRFSSAPWVTTGKIPVMVGGAGGIGSWLSLFLSRAGFSVHLYDFDTVSTTNIGGQLFRVEDIGTPKVSAVSEIISIFSGENINVYNQSISEGTTCISPITMTAFDNIAARRILFNSWKTATQGAVNPIFIDGRLLAEQLQIYCVTPANIERYEQEALFEDGEGEQASCTLKQTTHVAAIIAGLMVGFLTNHITNINIGEAVREVPFFYEYFVPLNLTVNEN